MNNFIVGVMTMLVVSIDDDDGAADVVVAVVAAFAAAAAAGAAVVVCVSVDTALVTYVGQHQQQQLTITIAAVLAA